MKLISRFVRALALVVLVLTWSQTKISAKECPGNCQDDCDENQKWINGTALCPETCDNLDEMRCMGLSTKPGCECINGTVLAETDSCRCITREQCPVKSD